MPNLLCTRTAGILAGIVLAVIFLGCMSLQIGGGGGGGSTCSEDGVSCQKGTVELAPNETRDVYYPLCYSRPPNLELKGIFDEYELMEQKEDHFTIRSRSDCWVRKICWKARGQRGCPAPPLVTPPPPQIQTPPTAGIKASGPQEPETAPTPTPTLVP